MVPEVSTCSLSTRLAVRGLIALESFGVASAARTDAGAQDGRRCHTTPASASRTTNHTRLFTGLAVLAMVAGVVLWMRLGGVSSGRVTLAVLPFENVGSDPAREYLATGLTQETSASLA